MTRRIVLTVMCLGWVAGATIGVVPMFWNNWSTAEDCEFDEVLPPWYMAGIVTPLFTCVWVCMLVLYVKIWLEASRQARQMRTSFSGSGLATKGGSDWKSIQVKKKYFSLETCLINSFPSWCFLFWAVFRYAGCHILLSHAPRYSSTPTAVHRQFIRLPLQWPLVIPA